MNLFSPTILKEICYKYHLSPSKDFGQNYLISKGVIEKIVDLAEVTKRDTIVEIGPGFGTLTFALAKVAKKVIAFEIEKKLKPYWDDHKKDNIEIVWGDALVQFRTYGHKLNKDFKVVANLPYQVTSGALRMLLCGQNRPVAMVLMVQKEVGDRIVAPPGKMSLLSVLCQLHSNVKLVKKVPPGAFWPAPKVQSAVLQFNMKKANDQQEKIIKLAKIGFASKRKTLLKNLQSVSYKKEQIIRALLKIGKLKTVRAQELSIDDWINLYKTL